MTFSTSCAPASRRRKIAAREFPFRTSGNTLEEWSLATFKSRLAETSESSGLAADGTAIDSTLSLATPATDVREVHYALTLTYNTTDDQFEGPLLYGDTDELTQGNILIIRIPANRPASADRAKLQLDTEANAYYLRDFGSTILLVRDLIPGQIYWAIRTPNGFTLLNPVGGIDISRTHTVTLTNSQVKNLDTTYIELVPAPGAGNYLSVELMSVEKMGDDVPAVQNPRMYYIAVSADTTLTEAEVAAGNSETFTFVNVPTWPGGEERYVFVGVPDDRRDIISMNVPTTEEPEDFFARVFERVTGTVDDANGVAVKWWRTKVAFDTQAVFGSNTYATGWGSDENIAIVEDIIRYAYAAAIFVNDDSADKPVHSAGNEYTWINGDTLNNYLSADADTRFLASVSGHDLAENEALQFGVILNISRGGRARAYSAAVFDEFVQPANDVTLAVTVRYKTLTI